MKKERVDLLLVQKGYFSSRNFAQRSIIAGLVFVNQERINQVGMKVPIDAVIEVKGQPYPYVSRGGVKLEEALRVFSIDISEKVMVDVGASTGGFTDCALKNGVRLVYAIDVGYGQLAWKLREDPRVIVMERTNFRFLKPEDLQGETPDFATIDVSFISLAHILSPLVNILLPYGQVIVLVKTQFEAGRTQVGKKGIVQDPIVHKQVLLTFVQLAFRLGFDVQGLIPSPIQGGEGNIEFLIYLIKRKPFQMMDWKEKIEQVVQFAHDRFLK
jgi:23S rRNA (cytidine1920-2'-O)/16S rRNA (cytidine1409-2'-O)-methyltransferase